MSLCSRFDFGASKHPSMIYSSNHSTAKLTKYFKHAMQFSAAKTSPGPRPIPAILDLNPGWQTDFG